MTSTSEGTAGQEAPHFTREWLLGAVQHLRGDLAASLSGEGADDRARSRLRTARALGLDRIAAEAIAAFDRASADVANLAWPGGLEHRYVALAGALRTLADVSTALIPHDSEHAHLTELAGVLAGVELASASGFRRRTAEAFRGLYVIVDPEQTNGRDAAWVAEQALAGGATAVQLRVKNMDKGDWLELAVRVREACEAQGAALVINDHPDVAVAAGAHGVHLGQHDLPLDRAREVLTPWQVAGTSNALAGEALASLNGGADYIAVGRMFPTQSKLDTRPAGPETLRAVRGAVPADGPPVVAIGGITEENAAEIAAAGADGICVIAAVSSAEDPCEAAARLLAAFRGASQT